MAGYRLPRAREAKASAPFVFQGVVTATR